MENWALIEDFPPYAVSDLGSVMNTETGVFLTPYLNSTKQGASVIVNLRGPGVQTTRALRRLVAEAFVPQFEPDPHHLFDTPVLKDGDHWNVVSYNIAWRPRWFAMRYSRTMAQSWIRLPTPPVICVETGVTYSSVVAAAIENCENPRDIFNSAGEMNSYVFPFRHSYRFVR